MTHNLDSTFLFIHPPAAIIGYIFIIITFLFFIKKAKKVSTKKWEKYTRVSHYLSWFFNLFGLITGMLWAQFAWGSYWSWDPKETATLIIFIFLCLSIVTREKNKKKLTIVFLAISIIAIAANIYITLSNFGLHSYGFT